MIREYKQKKLPQQLLMLWILLKALIFVGFCGSGIEGFVVEVSYKGHKTDVVGVGNITGNRNIKVSGYSCIAIGAF